MNILQKTLNSRSNWWMVAVAVVVVGAMAMVASIPQASATTGQQTSVVTRIRDQAGQLPCSSLSCIGQIAPAGDTVWDTVKVSDGRGLPTGSVSFWYFVGTAHCDTRPVSKETVALNGPIAFNTTGASSTPVGPLAPGDYSYRAFYTPDAAAQALGIKATPGECEQLRVEGIN